MGGSGTVGRGCREYEIRKKGVDDAQSQVQVGHGFRRGGSAAKITRCGFVRNGASTMTSDKVRVGQVEQGANLLWSAEGMHRSSK